MRNVLSRIRTRWIVAVTGLGLTVAVYAGIVATQGTGTPPAPSVASEPVWHASWAFRPQSLAEVMAASRLAVEAEVTGVRAGPDLVERAAGHPGGYRIPTQRVAFSVVRALAGSAPEKFELFKTGASGARAFSLEGDPPYQPGERYVLFVSQRPDGSWLPSGPDARLAVGTDGRLKSFVSGPLAQELGSRTTDELASALPGLPLATATTPPPFNP